MQKILRKVLAFVEKNVEWAAVAAGMAFFLYMAWTYVITKPVFKSIGGVVVTAGNVDETIDSTSGDTLRSLVDVPEERVPNFKVTDFGDVVSSTLAMSWTKPTEVAQVWNYQPVQLGAVAGDMPKPQQQAIVTALPELPAAKPLLSESGKTTIVAPPPPPGAAPADNGTKDIEWTTVAFYIPSDALTKQWTRAFGPSKPNGPWKINNGMVGSEFLAVDGYRSEKLPNGNWGPDVLVPRLWNSHIPSFPNKNDKAAQLNYLGAIANSLEVATPKFPDLAGGAAGSQWRDPISLIQSMVQPAVPIASVPAATPPAAAPVVQVSSVESTEPTVAKVDGVTFPVAPVPAVGNLNPAALPPPPPPAAPVAGAAAAPAASVQPDIVVYLHDDSIQPGKTYRYRMVYKLLNPVFNHPPDNLKNKKWADQFALVSPASDYAPEITVPLRTYFYCAQAGLPTIGDRLTFPFEVFSWGRGVWNKHTFTVNPGDQIGGVINGIDYSTGYTYIDQRKHNAQRSIVTVMDNEGNAVLRDAEKDAGGADRKLRAEWVDATAGLSANSQGVPAGSAPVASPNGASAPAAGPANTGPRKTDNSDNW